MSFPTVSVFHDLIASYSTWPALSSYLTSAEGGHLRIDDNSTPESPYAIIRYVKGKSDMSLPHVRAFRSVVWDTISHRPVSVTPFKSFDGESLPSDASPADYRIEVFMDGVTIGMFWDKYNARWRIHSRSTMDANCRYYSQTTPFKDMFWEAAAIIGLNLDTLDKGASYTFVLQHPENRIVCSVAAPRIHMVEKVLISDDCRVCFDPIDHGIPRLDSATWTDVRNRLDEVNRRFKHNVQGYVVKDHNGRRWKIRTPEYNRVRRIRSNTPRRDFVWLSAWRDGTLFDYLALYPEERTLADATINRWKRATSDVYQYYVDVFKARNLDKSAIPPKYRPLVYGLHTKFMEELRPVGRSVDWKTTVSFMNDRDVPQMLFVINWDLRKPHADAIPIEPPVAHVPAAGAGAVVDVVDVHA